MKPEDIPPEMLAIAKSVFAWTEAEIQSKNCVEYIARAIMAAEKRGEEAAQAKMAALLKDPAAVRVNYLRGDIACQDLIREGEGREREACAVDLGNHLMLKTGLSVSAIVGAEAAIRNRGKP